MITEEQQKESQRQLIAYLLNDMAKYYEYSSRISMEFFTDKYRLIYTSIVEMLKRDEYPDVFSLSTVEGLTIDELIDIQTAINYSGQIETHIGILHEYMVHTRLRMLMMRITPMLYCIDSEEIIQTINDTVSNCLVEQETSTHISAAIDDLTTKINERRMNREETTGVPTGFSILDGFTNGLQNTDLIIIAAEPSQGKTSFALNILNNAAAEGRKGVVYSYEMSNRQLTARLISNNARLSSKSILTRPLDEGQYHSYLSTADKLKQYGIYLDPCKSNNLSALKNSLRAMKLRYDVSFAMIDYIQLIENDDKRGSNDEQKIGGIARSLKNMAKELDIPIIALSQLSRDKDNPVPSLKRLRQSGQIEEAADIVILLYRPEHYGRETIDVNGMQLPSEGLALIDLAKGRNYGTTKFVLQFDKQRTLFSNHYIDNTPPLTDEDRPF